MRRFFRVLFTVAAGLAIGYSLHVYFKPPPPAATPIMPASLPPVFERLSARVEGDINTIFSPLEGSDAPMPTQDLRKLRENFQDGLDRVSINQRAMYEAAVNLCDSLLRAVNEREKSMIRLLDSRSKPSAAVADRGRGKRDSRAQETDLFFEVTIKKDWASRSQALRQQVADQYSQLRTQERSYLQSL